MKRNRLPAGWWRDPVAWLACGLGSGASPWAPGTAGTLAALPLWLALRPVPLAGYLAVVALMFAAGVWICGRTARRFGSHDPSGIVWDEVVGVLLALAAAPPGWPWAVAGVVLFRIFDIAKPWPVSWADRRVGGGLGIMLDDLVAGALALGLLQAAHLSF